MSDKPKLYSDLASWFHLLSRPDDYAEEAEFVQSILSQGAPSPRPLVLELGAGAGNNALHLKRHFGLTLTDLSNAMLQNSRRINPECEHLPGDMRTLRLGRTFDAVFIHDAIMYMLNEGDLRAAIKTAAQHCRPGGRLLIMPDYVRETFRSGVNHGGHDGYECGLRYFEWTFDPDSTDTNYTVDFVYLLREGSQPVRVVHDPHICGLFPRKTWLEVIEQNGFTDARAMGDPWGREVFVATRLPGGG